MSKGNKFSKEAEEILKKADAQGYLDDSDVRNFLSDMLISEGGYIMDTGSKYDANAIIVLRLAEHIKEHPILWKLFMIG